MNGKRYLLFMLAALLCLTSFDINAQENLNVNLINQYYHNWRDGVYDVCVEGDFAYLACGFEGFRIVDISNPGAAFDAGQLIYEDAATIAVDGNYAYLGNSYDGLYIIDIANSDSPQQIAYIHMDGYQNSIRVAGGYLFVCYQFGLKFIDISCPAEAQVVWSSTDLYDVRDIDVHGNIAYAACTYDGLQVLDITNISSPQIVGSYQCNDGEWVNGAAVAGNYAFLSCGGDAFRVIDLATMQMVASIDSLAYGFKVKVSGDYAYFTYGNPECPLAIIDISNPLSPQTLGIYDPPQDIINFDIAGDMAYAADFQHGLRMVDISNPQNPHEDYCYSRYGHDLDVIVSGNYAYVREDYKLKVIDITDPQLPGEIGFYETDILCEDIEVAGNTGYMIQSSNTCMYSIDLSNPCSPSLLGTFTVPSYDVHYRMAIYDHYAYLVENGGLRIVDIADPVNMQEAGFYYRPIGNAVIAIHGHYAFVCGNDRQLLALDLSNPISPISAGSCNLGENCAEIKGSEGLLYVVTRTKLWIFSATSFDSWLPFSVVTLFSGSGRYLQGIDIYNKYVYLVGDSIGLCVYDAADPADPRCTGYYSTPGATRGVAAAGNLAVVADYSNLGFYDCTPAITDIYEQGPAVSRDFQLPLNYPNPFNAATRISFTLGMPADVNLEVYDVLGRRISSYENHLEAGEQSYTWDGSRQASGVYYYTLRIDENMFNGKMTLLK